MVEVNRLAQSKIFRELNPELLMRLLAQAERRELVAGDYLFRVDQEYTREIYIVIDGEVVIQRVNGQSYSLGRGEFVGLSSFLDRAPYSSSAVVKSHAELLVLPDAGFNEIKLEFPELSTAVNRSIAERIRRWNPGRRGTTGILIQPVRSVMTVPFAACGEQTSLAEVMALMKARKIGCLGVVDDAGRLLGMVTPARLADAVILKEASSDECLSSIGYDDAHIISPDSQLWEAEQLQEEASVKYLAVVEDDKPIGMISQTDIVRALCLQAQRNILIGRAVDASSLEELQALFEEMDEVAASALENNRHATTAIRIVSETHLAISRRAIELTLQTMAEDGLAAPAVKFAVLIMGSGGRKEMMLDPDQDNGLILADSPDAQRDEVRNWFKTFAERINLNLAKIGYPLCPGEIMARNPLFHKSLADWKRQVSHLVERPTEKAARWSNVFFDFDTLYGDDTLTVALRKHVHQALDSKRLLLSLMVEDDAEGGPALGFFNRLITSEEGESKGKIDIKRNGLRIIADAARIYALSVGINASSTTDRLNALVRYGLFDADFADSIISANEELIAMTLDHQLEQKKQGQAPDKLIDPESIPPYLREALRDSMLAVKRLQDRLQGDFARMNF